MAQNGGGNATWKVLQRSRGDRWLRPRFGTSEQRSKQTLYGLETGRSNRDSCELDMEGSGEYDKANLLQNGGGGACLLAHQGTVSLGDLVQVAKMQTQTLPSGSWNDGAKPEVCLGSFMPGRSAPPLCFVLWCLPH